MLLKSIELFVYCETLPNPNDLLLPRTKSLKLKEADFGNQMV